MGIGTKPPHRSAARLAKLRNWLRGRHPGRAAERPSDCASARDRWIEPDGTDVARILKDTCTLRRLGGI